jgi:AcrR family transcriptional regulator
VAVETTTEEIPVSSVTDGVFFAPPEELPRGRHNLSRKEVRTVQRERLLAAATELLAARGYRGFGPGEVARRAGVSLATFYDCFENMEECVFAGYDRFIEVLMGRMLDIDADSLPGRGEAVRAVIDAYLQTLQSDLVVARAFQVEIDALGPEARERRRNSLGVFAGFIRDVTLRTAPGGDTAPDLPWTAYIGVVYAARQLASDELDRPEPDLVGLGEDLVVWVADLFRPR